MTSFNFEDECGAAWASTLLDNLAPRFSVELERLRGRKMPGVIHFVLSDHSTHIGRFPPDQTEIDRLNDGEPRFESHVDQRPDPPWLKVAFGVTEVSRPGLNPPAGVPAGDDVVFLDIERIAELAKRFGVPREAFLVLTVIHELSHVYREHAHQVPGATHGWFGEGQAQEDTLAVLRSLLPDAILTNLAIEAMRGMARLAPEQPPAYQYFDMYYDELNHLARRGVSSDARSCTIRTDRRVSVISKPGIDQIEARVVGNSPVYGEHVYLTDHTMESGPWVVVGWRADSRTGNEGSKRREDNTEERVSWRQLAKGQDFSGRKASPWQGEKPGHAAALSDVEVADLRASFAPNVMDAIVVADEAWQASRVSWYETMAEHRGSEWAGANPLLELDPNNEDCPLL